MFVQASDLSTGTLLTTSALSGEQTGYPRRILANFF